MRRQIIDFHTHIFPEDVEQKAVTFLREYYDLDIKCKATLEHLMQSAQDAEVEMLVIHATATVQTQVRNVNRWIGALVSEKVMGFGTIHPDFKEVHNELAVIAELGLKGIKMHPEFQKFKIDEPRMFRIYEAIGDRFPILMHMGDKNLDFSSPKRLAHILEKFPKLRIIGAHLGGYSRWDEVMKYLVGKNLYFDTSSALCYMTSEEAIEIIRGHGVEKILFGTDYPITSHKEELERFYRLPLTERERELILWENAQRILRK